MQWYEVTFVDAKFGKVRWTENIEADTLHNANAWAARQAKLNGATDWGVEFIDLAGSLQDAEDAVMLEEIYS